MVFYAEMSVKINLISLIWILVLRCSDAVVGEYFQGYLFAGKLFLKFSCKLSILINI